MHIWTIPVTHNTGCPKFCKNPNRMHTKTLELYTLISFILHENPTRVSFDCVKLCYHFLRHHKNIFINFSTLDFTIFFFLYFLFHRVLVKSRQHSYIWLYPWISLICNYKKMEEIEGQKELEKKEMVLKDYY